jgi:hypothetical protein
MVELARLDRHEGELLRPADGAVRMRRPHEGAQVFRAAFQHGDEIPVLPDEPARDAAAD